MMEKKYLIGMFSVVLISFVLGFIGLAMISSANTAATASDGILYHSKVTIMTTGDFPGRTTLAHQGISEVIPCPKNNPECHNTLTNNGKDAIMHVLGNGVSLGNMTFIMLCNASAGDFACNDSASNSSMAYGLNITSGCGLNVTAGAYTIQGTAGTGNWTIWNTFTDSCGGININETALTNGTGPNYTFFAYNRFTQTTLQTNDQLTVNWTLWIT